MICFAAIVAHPVVSIPAIGKGTDHQIAATMAGLKQIRQELYASKPETILVISPHVKAPSSVMSINQNTTLTVTFRDFGDLTPYGQMNNNLGLAYSLRQEIETAVPMVAIETSELDHATSVPLFHLLDILGNVPVISVGTALDLDLPTHYACGERWRETLDLTNQRVAILVSADLSHDAKNQFSADAIALDRKIITWIERHDTKALLALPIDNPLVQSICGLRPVVMALGLLQTKNYSVQPLSFEHAVGIGYYNALIRLR